VGSTAVLQCGEDVSSNAGCQAVNLEHAFRRSLPFYPPHNCISQHLKRAGRSVVTDDTPIGQKNSSFLCNVLPRITGQSTPDISR
jgi:hypothetical protein